MLSSAGATGPVAGTACSDTLRRCRDERPRRPRNAARPVAGRVTSFAGAVVEDGPAGGGSVGGERVLCAAESAIDPGYVFGEEDVVVLPFGFAVEVETPAVVGDEGAVFGVGLCVGLRLRERRLELRGECGCRSGFEEGAAGELWAFHCWENFSRKRVVAGWREQATAKETQIPCGNDTKKAGCSTTVSYVAATCYRC